MANKAASLSLALLTPVFAALTGCATGNAPADFEAKAPVLEQREPVCMDIEVTDAEIAFGKRADIQDSMDGCYSHKPNPRRANMSYVWEGYPSIKEAECTYEGLAKYGIKLKQTKRICRPG